MPSTTRVLSTARQWMGMQRLGRYEIVRELGRGGQGLVYEAVLHGPGGFRRTVALKVLAEAGGLAHEARIGGWLRHPNLVDVFEVGHADGDAFCAMEYCPDGPLADRLPLPDRAAVEVALQVCAALQYAHDELGLVHLDLKPQNLLLHGATVKVADLGISRARGFDHDGRVRGTRGYMAPEQARGAAVDARSDVYALGIVLHELTTGSRMGASTTMAFDTLLQRTQTAIRDASATTALDDDPTQPVVQVDPLCPAWLAPIVAKCTQTDPVDRYASMGELAEALRAADIGGLGLAEHLGVEPREETAPRERAAERTFGRERELEEVRAALAPPGIVTLKGPAGIGKSHLARAVASGAPSVALAEAREVSDLLRAVGAVLDISLASTSPVTQAAQIGRVLANRAVAVLILDDLGAIEGAAAVIARWAAQAPALRLIVTSRRALEVVGERIMEVGPLDAEGAVALLAARALERGADVAADPALPELARRLDGLPLALELAAGRLGVLSPSDLLDRLGLSLLRSAEGPERHSTLSSALDWSWEQLDEGKRTALSWLSVFRGGFTVEAAEVVLDGPALDRLGALMSQSLVATAGPRFRLLEPVREYAAERLVDPAPVEARHGRFYARLGTDEASEAKNGRHARAAIDADVREHTNLVAACGRALARGDGATAAACARAAWSYFEEFGPSQAGAELSDEVLDSGLLDAFWRLRVCMIGGMAWRIAGRSDRALGRYEEALAIARATKDPLLARALANMATVLSDRADWDGVEALLDEALAVAVAIGPRSAERSVRSHTGNLRRVQGRHADARAHDEAALAMARADGDRRLESTVLSNLGNLERLEGRPERARERHLEALAVGTENGNVGAQAIALGNLAAALYDLARFAEARDCLDRTLRLARNTGNRRTEGMALANIGAVQRIEGRPEEALQSYASAMGILEEAGYPHGLAATWLKIGMAQRDLLRFDEARESLDRALRLATEGRFTQLVAEATASHAETAMAQGRFAEARDWAEQDLELRQKVGQTHRVIAATLMLGRIAHASGRFDDARELLERGLAGPGEAQEPVNTALACCLLAEMALDRGDRGEALRAIARGRAAQGGAAVEATLADLEARAQAL